MSKERKTNLKNFCDRKKDKKVEIGKSIVLEPIKKEQNLGSA